MLILAVDIATSTGWAFYDTEKPVSAIRSGSMKFEGANAFQKVCDSRRKFPKLVRETRPDFAVFEAPLEHIPQFRKKTRTLLGEEEEVSTVNPRTITQLNRLTGAIQGYLLAMNIPCDQVSPKTWQSAIPKSFTGNTKARVKAFCDSLNIVSPNVDSRDACIIALWAAGHCQALKLQERAA